MFRNHCLAHLNKTGYSIHASAGIDARQEQHPGRQDWGRRHGENPQIR